MHGVEDDAKEHEYDELEPDAHKAMGKQNGGKNTTKDGDGLVNRLMRLGSYHYFHHVSLVILDTTSPPS